jgi:hypothetical protein
MLRHRGVEEAKLAKLRDSSQERLAELETSIAKLRLNLELSETEYEFLSKRLAILDTAK